MALRTLFSVAIVALVMSLATLGYAQLGATASQIDTNIATVHVYADPEWMNVITQRYYNAAEFDSSLVVSSDAPNPKLAFQYLSQDPEAAAIITDMMRTLKELDVDLDFDAVLEASTSAKGQEYFDSLLKKHGDDHRALFLRRIGKIVAKVAGPIAKIAPFVLPGPIGMGISKVARVASSVASGGGIRGALKSGLKSMIPGGGKLARVAGTVGRVAGKVGRVSDIGAKLGCKACAKVGAVAGKVGGIAGGLSGGGGGKLGGVAKLGGAGKLGGAAKLGGASKTTAGAKVAGGGRGRTPAAPKTAATKTAGGGRGGGRGAAPKTTSKTAATKTTSKATPKTGGAKGAKPTAAKGKTPAKGKVTVKSIKDTITKVKDVAGQIKDTIGDIKDTIGGGGGGGGSDSEGGASTAEGGDSSSSSSSSTDGEASTSEGGDSSSSSSTDGGASSSEGSTPVAEATSPPTQEATVPEPTPAPTNPRPKPRPKAPAKKTVPKRKPTASPTFVPPTSAPTPSVETVASAAPTDANFTPSTTTTYAYLQFQTFNAFACEGSSNGVLTGSALNQCSSVGSNFELRRCDPDAGEIIVSTFDASDSACEGTATDTYRLPVGCLPTPGSTSARETCMTASSSNIFASFPSGLVSLLSDSQGRCEATPNQANSWTFLPLNQCVPQSSAFVIIDSCDSSAGTFVQRTFATPDCSDDPSDTITLNLDNCVDNGSGRIRRQICVNV